MDGYEGLQQLLSSDTGFEMVILDTELPKMDGNSVISAIRNGSECPNIPILVLASDASEETVVTTLRRGADKYLNKPISPSRLLANVESLFRRTQWASKSAGKMADPNLKFLQRSVKLLTVRESEILKYLVQGFSNQQIAERLVISETTVKNHLAHIFKKLNVKNRTQAAYIAQKLEMY